MNVRTFLVLRVLVAAALLGMTAPGGAATSTRVSAFTYDASGLLVKEVVEPGNSNVCVVTVHYYDSFGNKNGATTRNCDGSALVGMNEAPAPGSPYAFASRTSTASYGADGQFAVIRTNALGHSESIAYDPRDGQVTSLTGPNGLNTFWSYDGFGRKLLETRADGNRTRYEYLFCNGYQGGTTPCPTYAVYVVRTTPLAPDALTQNGPIVLVYFDALEREIRRQTQGYDGSGTSTPIYVDTVYDTTSRVEKISKPYFSGQTPQWITFTYDNIQRVTSQTEPGAITTSFGYNGLVTTVADDLARVTTTTVNSQGQKVSVKDAANSTITFQYDPQGNLLSATDPAGNVVVNTYDIRGNKLSTNDPDLGLVTFSYNALGELITRSNQGVSQQFSYDLLGRTITRVEAEYTTTWRYDSFSPGNPGACGKSVGQLCEVSTSAGYSSYNQYDLLGRLALSSTTIDETYISTLSYDATGRPLTKTYPGGFQTQNVYTALGFLRQVKDPAVGGVVYWTANQIDAEARVTNQTYGNTISQQANYETTTGRLTSLAATGPLGASVLGMSYTYDDVGNVKTRTNSAQSVSEAFNYDSLNRLTSSSATAPSVGTVSTSYGYNAIGNLTSRSDLGTYTYNASGPTSTRPHAVTKVTYPDASRREYGYDVRGNLTTEIHYTALSGVVPALGRSTTYTTFDMPIEMTSSSATISFLYGPSHERVRQVVAGGTTTIYLNPTGGAGLNYEKDIKPLGELEHRYFVTAGSEVVALIKKTGTGVTTTRYMHRDGLGSVMAVTDGVGTVVERLSYEAFGRRRQTNGQPDLLGTVQGTETNRGYTDHEHLEEMGLIHMNGRIYNPIIARFTSADPYVQDPTDLQSYNRYSYIVNNPLGYTDPSGYLFGIGGTVKRELKRAERDFRREIRRPDSLLGPALRISGVAASTFCNGAFTVCSAAVIAATEATVSRAQGVKGSQLFENTAIAVAQSGMLAAAGSYLSGGFHVAAVGVIGGGVAAAQGQSFGTGFLSASVSFYASSLSPGTTTLDLVIASTVGGTVSELSGGKFANGAVTGAFSYATARLARAAASGQFSPYEDGGLEAGAAAAEFERQLSALRTDGAIPEQGFLSRLIFGPDIRFDARYGTQDRTNGRIYVYDTLRKALASGDKIIGGYAQNGVATIYRIAAHPSDVPGLGHLQPSGTMRYVILHEYGHIVRGRSEAAADAFALERFPK